MLNKILAQAPAFPGNSPGPTYDNLFGNPSDPFSGTEASQVSNFSQLVTTVINSVLNPLVLLIVGVALVTFLWGVVKYMGKSEDKDRAEGRKLMVYGLVALFVMVSVWGLVNVLVHTFNFADNGSVPVPRL